MLLGFVKKKRQGKKKVTTITDLFKCLFFNFNTFTFAILYFWNYLLNKHWKQFYPYIVKNVTVELLFCGFVILHAGLFSLSSWLKADYLLLSLNKAQHWCQVVTESCLPPADTHKQWKLSVHHQDDLSKELKLYLLMSCTPSIVKIPGISFTVELFTMM